MDNLNLENNNTSPITAKNLDSESFFDEQNDFVFVAKKTEKLASALYLITNLLSDNEPMKWTLRRKVSELLSFIITYKDIRQSNLPSFTITAKTKVLELVSFLEVSLQSGLVSQMNFSIIKQEFSNLLTALKNDQKFDSSNAIFSTNFFETSSHNFAFSRPDVNTSLKDSISIKDNNAFKSNNRQNIILGLLKKKKELSIKDIAMIIKDVSEKTIQRELISLIDAGVITKIGERRWSKYSLNIAK